MPHQFGGFADPDKAKTYTVQVAKEKPPKPVEEVPLKEEANSDHGDDKALAPESSPQDGAESEKETTYEQVEIEIPSFDHVNLYFDNVDLP